MFSYALFKPAKTHVCNTEKPLSAQDRKDGN